MVRQLRVALWGTGCAGEPPGLMLWARGACDRARARCAASRRRRQEDEQLAAVCGGAGCMHEQRVLVLRA